MSIENSILKKNLQSNSQVIFSIYQCLVYKKNLINQEVKTPEVSTLFAGDALVFTLVFCPSFPFSNCKSAHLKFLKTSFLPVD